MNADKQNDHFGIWPALLTPLTDTLAVNTDTLGTHIRLLLDAGCNGVTLFGTTGEGPSFTVEERTTVLQTLIQNGVPAHKILVHTGAAALPDSIALSKHATQLGVHGCLVMPPFFFKGVSEQGVIHYYRQLVSGVNNPHLRLVLYHLPQISCVPLTIPIIKQLISEYPDLILGVKDSGCKREESIALTEAIAPVQVWVGNEPDLQTMATLGSRGAVSGVANILPELVQKLIGLMPSDNRETDQNTIISFLSIFEHFPMLPAFKAMLSIACNDPSWLRMRPPLVALTPEEVNRLETMSNQLGFSYKR